MTEQHAIYNKIYFLNNQATVSENIPEGASYQCIHQLGERLLLIEVYKQGELAALENFCESDSLNRVALDTAHKAIELGIALDVDFGFAVNVYFQQTDFDFGFEVSDERAVALKAQFKVTYADDELSAAFAYPDAYVAELMEVEPVPRLLKRGLYNASKELMCFEYPLFSINRQNALLDEIGCFMESTSVGEQWLLDADEDNRNAKEQGAFYTFPVNQEELLASVNRFIEKRQVQALDGQQQPILENEIQNHEELYLVSFSDEGRIQAMDYIVNNELAHSEIFEVPFESHWLVFHAYMRSLQKNMILISRDPLKATNYVHIHAPVSHESIGEVTLEDGQYRLNSSTFHVNGNFIVHECKVYSKHDELIKTYLMKSPTNFDVYQEYENECRE